MQEKDLITYTLAFVERNCICDKVQGCTPQVFYSLLAVCYLSFENILERGSCLHSTRPLLAKRQPTQRYAQA